MLPLLASALAIATPVLDATTSSSPVPGEYAATPTLAVAYRGHGLTYTHPGVQVEYARPLAVRHSQRPAKRGPLLRRVRIRQVHLGGAFYIDSHLTNNTFVGLQGLVSTHLTRTRGYTTGWSFAAGLQRSFLNHASWSVDDSGEAYRSIGAGQFSGALSLTHEWAWDLERRHAHRREMKRARADDALPVQLFLRPRISALLGWSGAPFPVPTLSCDLGVRLALPGAVR